jgi:hypothetical protein
VSEGKILVGVEAPDEGTVPAIERAPMAGGIARLKTVQL